jgi:hypothetical protein
MAQHPTARQGVKLAVQSARENNMTTWQRIKYYVGIHGDNFGEDYFGAVKKAPPPPKKKVLKKPTDFMHKAPGSARIVRHHRMMPQR